MKRLLTVKQIILFKGLVVTFVASSFVSPLTDTIIEIVDNTIVQEQIVIIEKEVIKEIPCEEQPCGKCTNCDSLIKTISPKIISHIEYRDSCIKGILRILSKPIQRGDSLFITTNYGGLVVEHKLPHVHLEDKK